jgi:hypothetical protein
MADSLIDQIFELRAIDGVRALLSHCVKNAHPLRAGEGDEALLRELAAHVEKYFERSEAEMGDIPAATLQRGQALFARVGPEILLILATYSLPAAYAARNGVQVLAQTDRLGSDTNRRLFETTQMVIDVLRPGGLDRADRPESHGVGIRTAQKVRLMHAAVRRMILHHREGFAEAYGVPINQEDLLGTLMTFSWIVLDGLDRMGIVTSPEERDAYLETWLHVGRILGIEDRGLPRTVEEARALTDLIHARQIAPSEAGRHMTRALLDMMDAHLPTRLLSGLPPALLHFFLRENARVIDVPRADASVLLVRVLITLARLADELFGRSLFFAPLYRAANVALMQGMVNRERGPQRPGFNIPDHLADRWPRVPSALRASRASGR